MASPGIQQGIIRFGPFELDPVNSELRKRGTVVKLQPQHFAMLLMLAQRAGQLVSRDEIHRNIWGNDTFVDFERGINFSINQIRAALGDDAAKPRFIRDHPSARLPLHCRHRERQSETGQFGVRCHRGRRPSASCPLKGFCWGWCCRQFLLEDFLATFS